ncbi:MAG: hypothetical protein V3T84_02210 [Phycisphaerales bacterium]
MKRRLTKLVVFLLLGAIVNVAVAWGCAYWVKFDWRIPGRQAGYDHFAGFELPPDHVDAGRFAGYTVSRYQRFGSQRVSVVHSYAYDGLPGKTTIGFNDIIPQWARGFLDIHEFHTDESIDFRSEVNRYIAIVDGRGWPCLSLWGGMKLPKSGTVYSSGGRPILLVERRYWIIPLEPASPRGSLIVDSRLLLPLQPLWPGFAFNTIFYAALLWLLTFGPFAARRFIRRKRGRCINCGYDLRHAEHEQCPECGMTIPLRITIRS